MKNINVEYDMDKNDLDILLQDIVDEHKKKPSLAFIVENYPALLSIFNVNTIQMCLENIKEEKKNPKFIKKDDEFEDEGHDIESDPDSVPDEDEQPLDETNFSKTYESLMGSLDENHIPEADDEGRMALNQLENMRGKIDRMIEMIGKNDQIKSGVQSKLTLADDYITTVSDQLENDKKEEDQSEDSEPRGSDDMSDDAEALASAGRGTDEDYGYYGENEEVKEGVIEERRCSKVTGQSQSTRKDKKYMRCAKVDGKLKRVHYGDPKLRIKKSNPKRRKSFRARHKCSTAKPGSAKYFSCKNW